MDKYNLLDCTLRDGGYITNWKFEDSMIRDTIKTLVDARLDFVEVGYLSDAPYIPNTTQFHTVEQIADFLPTNRGDSQFLAMADVMQFQPGSLTPRTGKSIDGIRVVFYKHQIKEALALSKAIKTEGYRLFVQPMVTIDYTMEEYANLAQVLARLEPYAVSIVDSFGYMQKSDFRKYFKVVDDLMPLDTVIGFHSHNNMNLAFITAQDILEYETNRHLVIDASLYGMGRGAGNLNSELITNYYNILHGHKYDVISILRLISDYIIDYYKNRQWGYSPFMFITGLYHYHPNFACYLLEEENVSVSEFERFIRTIPSNMKTNCRKIYVMEMWNKFNMYK